jgi:uncharacterized membrane protein YeaQ/YmgE (transglycosylase-associated protein family)
MPAAPRASGHVVGAIIGSIVLLLIYRTVVGRGRSRTAY